MNYARLFSFIFTFLNKRLSFNQIKPSTKNFLQENITILDIGASGSPQEELRSISSISETYLCEPDKRVQEITRKSFVQFGFQKIHFLEHFLGDGSKSNFYLTKRQECSSLLEPNMKILAFFPLAERFANDEVLTTQTTTLDSLNIGPVDYLKIDTQGSELEILKHYAFLEKTLLIESEVEFLELYKTQPLHKDLDSFLSNKGFVLIDTKYSKWKLETSVQNKHDMLTQYLGRNIQTFGNALFLNKKFLPWNITKESDINKISITKICILLSRFKQISLAIGILERSYNIGKLNSEELALLKEECLNIKFKGLLCFFLPRKKKLSTFEFDREFL